MAGGKLLSRAARPLTASLLAAFFALREPPAGVCGQPDVVVRVLSANTVKLERLGVVGIAGSYTPSRLPECFTYTPQADCERTLPPKTISPSRRTSTMLTLGLAVCIPADSAINAHLKQLLPPKTAVEVETHPARPKGTDAFIVRRRDGLFVNLQLVQGGWARAAAKPDAGHADELRAAQAEAQRRQLGLWADCSEREQPRDDQFEELAGSSFEYGKATAVRRALEVEPPPSPGDSKNCADFANWEESVRFFRKYYPYYGDVAKLDRDEDGIPCPGLAHTANREKWLPKTPGLPMRKDSL